MKRPLSEIAAEVPTTEGIIASLRSENLKGRRVGLQLYGTEPNERDAGHLTAGA